MDSVPQLDSRTGLRTSTSSAASNIQCLNADQFSLLNFSSFPSPPLMLVSLPLLLVNILIVNFPLYTCVLGTAPRGPPIATYDRFVIQLEL